MDINKKHSIAHEIEIVTRQLYPDDPATCLDVYHKRPNFKSGGILELYILD